VKSVIRNSRLLQVMVGLVLSVVVLSGGRAQVSPKQSRRMGLVQDWTQGHIVFSHNVLTENPRLAAREPRAVQQWLREHASLVRGGIAMAAGVNAAASAANHGDWNVSLGTARVAAGMSPAKFNLDPTLAPDCTNDYVVFALNVPGSATQANIMAFNNLYSGTGGFCGTGGPSVLFAYEGSTGGGRLSTSPALSLDGTKIAYVESQNTSAVFHVLTWATGVGNGTSATAPAVPGTGNTASLVSIPFGTSAITRSSPWIDYTNDVAYVASAGRIFKFTGVFQGTPALAGAPWPAVVSVGTNLSGPVLDQVTGHLFVGGANGILFSVDSTTATTVNSLTVATGAGTSPGIQDPPIVDSTNGVVFAVTANNGVSAAMVEADTSSLTLKSTALLGQGASTGTAMTIYGGALDNNYFNDPTTGTMLICGTDTASLAPVLYTFNFTGVGGALNPVPVSTSPIVTSTRARCSPITEFFNPNVGGGTDFFFFGLNIDCFGAGSNGCAQSRQSVGTPPAPVRVPNGISAIVVDNSSTVGQASSIYFSSLANNGRAFKLTQAGLN